MSLKPRPPRPMPPDIAAWGTKHLAADDPYKLVGDRLYEQYRDEDFADLYHKEGKPGISPVLLSLVTVFQTLENLTDRDTVKAVLTRIDWKYALHLPFDDDVFNFTVLHDFRKRLITHKAESRVFDTVLVQLKGLGLIKARGTQRTDSLSLLSRARDLGRLEFLHATVRNALRNLLNVDEDWTQNNAKPEWAERYVKACRAERTSAEECAMLMQQIGADGEYLLICSTLTQRRKRSVTSRRLASCAPRGSNSSAATRANLPCGQTELVQQTGLKLPTTPRRAGATSVGRAGWVTSCK